MPKAPAGSGKYIGFDQARAIIVGSEPVPCSVTLRWVLTPTAATDLESFDRLKGVVMSLGADVLVLSAQDHDRLVAVVSHVPHLVAATLMNAASAGAEQDGALLRLAAGGFFDTWFGGMWLS